MGKRAYVAGPLFNDGERATDWALAMACTRAGYSSYVPHVDGGRRTPENEDGLYARDLEELKACDVVVANLEGVDVDSGTAWEIGYAVALGKRVYGFRTDSRYLNLMVEKSVKIFNDISDLCVVLGADAR